MIVQREAIGYRGSSMSMGEQANVARSKTSQSRGVNLLLAVLSAVAAAFVLWVTWYFYRDVFNVPVVDWLGLVQPALMMSGGVMGLVAAGLLLLGHTAGRDVLKTAVSIFPLILALRLFVLILRLIGFTVS